MNYDNGDDDCRYLVIATDGIWDVLSNEEVAQIISKTTQQSASKNVDLTETLKTCALVLTQRAQDKGSKDNITVLVMKLQPETANKQ